MPTPIARPAAFGYRTARKRAVLQCERIPVENLARNFGTPLYCYSATAIRARYEAFDAAFANGPHTICYSVKANSNLAILKLLWKQGCGFDVVSGGELERVLQLGRRAAQNVVFSGVGKTEAEMDLGLRAGILLFNVESESEMEHLAARAKRSKKRAPVAFRVNPDVSAETHPYIATGMREHKFGVAIGDAERLYAAAARHLWIDVAGVSVHIGSQIMSSAPFREALERVAELVSSLQRNGHNIRYVDGGGGLGVPYEVTGGQWPVASDADDFHDQFATRAQEYAKALTAPLRDLKVHLLLEPGRALVAPAGALITRVLYVKQNGAKRFAVVDAAMNDLIRPSLYGAHHEIVPATWKEGELQAFDVVGPICETGDFFARDRQLPELREGDLLAILDAGAYGTSLASNYNTRPRAAEVMVDGGKARVIRRREKTSDLWRDERA
jgi:diaminopimelate decarboxylase